MKSITLKAPAKVNYRLDVLSRRPDGYHELRMIMQRVDLCDEVSITVSGTPGISVLCGKEGVPDGPGNIAWRAADALLQRRGRTEGLVIRIDKRIPVAAGLGGGSSDGATVLMGVNELLGLGFSDQELMEIGVTLGADVPFFIFRRPALAEGIGDRLTALERTPDAWIVLVNPNIHVSTAWVYQNLQLTEGIERAKLPSFIGDVVTLSGLLVNDLEAVTIGRFPIIEEIKEQLLAAGAVNAMMSGSGPTVFGLFETETEARRAAEEIARREGWFTAAVRTIN